MCIESESVCMESEGVGVETDFGFRSVCVCVVCVCVRVCCGCVYVGGGVYVCVCVEFVQRLKEASSMGCRRLCGIGDMVVGYAKFHGLQYSYNSWLHGFLVE